MVIRTWTTPGQFRYLLTDAGWLVVLEPTPGRYAREIAEIKRSNNGVGGQSVGCKSKRTCRQTQVYIQSEFAQQFLEALSLANRHMLEVRHGASFL